MRNYTVVDLLKFHRFANENKDMKPIDAVKAYNEKFPELSSKEKLINLSKALGLTDLHKKLTETLKQ